MQVFLLIWIIVSSILCLGGISWLSFEIVTDVKAKRAQSDEITAAPIEVAPIVEENAPIPESIVTSIAISEQSDGVLVVDIVWKEHIGKGKSYRYAPNGLDVHKGDTVLVPTFDASRHGEIARKATVCSDIYTVTPAELHFKLKPILRVMQSAQAE